MPSAAPSSRRIRTPSPSPASVVRVEPAIGEDEFVIAEHLIAADVLIVDETDLQPGQTHYLTVYVSSR